MILLCQSSVSLYSAKAHLTTFTLGTPKSLKSSTWGLFIVNTTFIFGKTKAFPANLVNFSLVTSIAPLKLYNQRFDIFSEPFWEFKTWHGVGGNCLNHCLYENLTTNFRQQFLFPPLELFPNFLLNNTERFLFNMTNQRWKTQVLLISLDC